MFLSVFKLLNFLFYICIGKHTRTSSVLQHQTQDDATSREPPAGSPSKKRKYSTNFESPKTIEIDLAEGKQIIDANREYDEDSWEKHLQEFFQDPVEPGIEEANNIIKMPIEFDVHGFDLNLVEIPQAMERLDGFVKELEDSAYSTVNSISTFDNIQDAVIDADWCLLVGSIPRGIVLNGKEIKERSDLLKINGGIFTTGFCNWQKCKILSQDPCCRKSCQYKCTYRKNKLKN